MTLFDLFLVTRDEAELLVALNRNVFDTPEIDHDFFHKNRKEEKLRINTQTAVDYCHEAFLKSLQLLQFTDVM